MQHDLHYEGTYLYIHEEKNSGKKYSEEAVSGYG